jgi:hypothetical protein
MGKANGVTSQVCDGRDLERQLPTAVEQQAISLKSDARIEEDSELQSSQELFEGN